MIASLKRLFIAIKRQWEIRRDPVAYARSLGVQVGEDCSLLEIQANTFGSEPWLIKLGNHVEITSGVRFITHDGGMWVFREKFPEIDIIAPIVVGDNVFIGINAILLPGVTVGDNCVIAAGAVVSRDIPSGTVAAGVPAHPIKTIEEYWEDCRGNAFYIRSHSPEEKREVLTRHFNL
jgi:acetyltransferase-like isoleucine patch superfamily enzyme